MMVVQLVLVALLMGIALAPIVSAKFVVCIVVHTFANMH